MRKGGSGPQLRVPFGTLVTRCDTHCQLALFRDKHVNYLPFDASLRRPQHALASQLVWPP
eukprot:2499908-Amphidinium_carterae.2